MTMPAVTVGDPATIRLYTDTRAAVVVRVSPKSIVVARVETGPSAPAMSYDAGAYGVRPALSEGILDQPIAGTEERFRWSDKRKRFMNGTISLTLGHSHTLIDYRF